MKTTFLLISIFCLSGFGIAQVSNTIQDPLPAIASNFIKTNFAGETILQSFQKNDDNKVEYHAHLSNGIEIEFDGEGNWEEVDSKTATAIPTGFIPSKITSYVSKNFPTQKIAKIEKDSNSYDVELTNGLDVEFNLNGDFLRIDD